MSYKWPNMEIALASTYNSDAYSAGTYGGATIANSPIANPIAIGPVTLPITGAALGGVILIAFAVALAVWAYQNRRKRLNRPLK